MLAEDPNVSKKINKKTFQLIDAKALFLLLFSLRISHLEQLYWTTSSLSLLMYQASNSILFIQAMIFLY